EHAGSRRKRAHVSVRAIFVLQALYAELRIGLATRPPIRRALAVVAAFAGFARRLRGRRGNQIARDVAAGRKWHDQREQQRAPTLHGAPPPLGRVASSSSVRAPNRCPHAATSRRAKRTTGRGAL